MSTTITPEQIQAFLAQQAKNSLSTVAEPSAALPGMEGFDETETFGTKSRHMYSYYGRFEGTIKRIDLSETDAKSPKGRRPLFVTEVEVTESTNDDVPIGCTISYVKTGGDRMMTEYMHRAVKEMLGALLHKPASDIKLPDVALAVSEQQPHTGEPIGWEVMDVTSKRTGKQTPVVSFFSVE